MDRPVIIESVGFQLVVIDRKEYDQLLEDSRFLQKLRAAGVDNWDGYDEDGE